MSQVTAQLSKASGQYNNGVISFLLHGEDGNNLAATRVVTDSVHHHNVSPFAEISFLDHPTLSLVSQCLGALQRALSCPFVMSPLAELHIVYCPKKLLT